MKSPRSGFVCALNLFRAGLVPGLLVFLANLSPAANVPAEVPEAMKPVYAQALAGDIPSVLKIADMYLNGEGVPRNEAKARELLYDKAWSHPDGQERMALIARRGYDGNPPNLMEEIDWLCRATAGGNPRTKALLEEYAAASPEKAAIIQLQPDRMAYRRGIRAGPLEERMATFSAFTTAAAEKGAAAGLTRAQICTIALGEVLASMEMNLVNAAHYMTAFNAGALDLPTLRARMSPKLAQFLDSSQAKQIAQSAAPRPQAPANPTAGWRRDRTVGEIHGDGVIVYVDGSGQHGLILSLTERPTGKPIDGGARPTHFDAQTGLTAWYLPTLEEWRHVFANRRRIEQALTQAKGQPLGKNGFYWTASTVNYQSLSGRTSTTHWCYQPVNDTQRESDPYNVLAAVRSMRQF